MQRVFRTLLFWTLILGACSTGISSPPAVPASTTAAPPVLPTTAVPDPDLLSTVATPHIDRPPDGELATSVPTFEGCMYTWAYKDMPELSASFQGSIHALQPEAQANAYTFGEDCTHSDGSVDFLAMETDFNITLQVDDLANESDLGEWIVKVMGVIENIPQEQIVGPMPGRVGITFRSEGDQKIINFYIRQYHELPSGVSYSEIYQALQIPQ